MVSITVKVNDAQVTIEGPEDFVREEVRHLTSRIAQAASTGSNVASPEKPAELTEVQIIAEKKPASHFETVAVLAYFMKQAGVEEFTEDDMRKAYIRARVRPPKVVGQAIRDAKNKYEFIEDGSNRGSYRISHHGERTVEFDLPRG